MTHPHSDHGIDDCDGQLFFFPRARGTWMAGPQREDTWKPERLDGGRAKDRGSKAFQGSNWEA